MDLMATMERNDINQMTVGLTQTTQFIQGFYTHFEQQSTEVRLQNDPFYYSYKMDDLTTHIHPFGDDGDYIIYDTNQYNKHDDKYLVRPVIIDAYTMLNMIEYMGGMDHVEYSEEFFYDPEVMLFNKILNGYMIKHYLRFYTSRCL